MNDMKSLKQKEAVSKVSSFELLPEISSCSND
jgi:hypothetical protein